MIKHKIIFLIGPTAIGKSNVAVSLAQKINGEIISCDSMQIYKRMGILTSWPSTELKKKVPHHLIGILSPEKEYNVSAYRRDALREAKKIIKKKKIPLFVGGTGLYMSVVVDGIFRQGRRNLRLRERLYEESRALGNVYLHNRLISIDPEAAVKIHPHDTKRIVRALEVFENTGKTISSLQKQRRGLWDKFDVQIFCLNMQREELYSRINARTEKMFKQGLTKEVKKLLQKKLSRTARCAIGIKELEGYFSSLYDLAAAKEMVKRNTRLYAKRQLTWFRKDKRIKWIGVGRNETPKSVVKKILKSYGKNAISYNKI